MEDARHPVESLGSVFAALFLRALTGWTAGAVREKIHVVYRPAKAEAVEVGDVSGHNQKVVTCERRHERRIRPRLVAWKMKV
jgi:hypothetical protein